MYFASIEIGSAVVEAELSLGYSGRYQEMKFSAGDLQRRIASPLNGEPYIQNAGKSKEFITFLGRKSISKDYPDIIASAFHADIGKDYKIISDRNSFLPTIAKTDKAVTQPILCYVIIDRVEWIPYYMDISKEMSILETFHYNGSDGFLLSIPSYSKTERTAERLKITGYRPQLRNIGSFPEEFQSFEIMIYMDGEYPSPNLKITATELEITEYERKWFRNRWVQKAKNLVLRITTKNKIPFFYAGTLPRAEANDIIAKHIRFNGGSHLVTEGYDYRYIQISDVEDSRDAKMIRQEIINKLKPELEEYGTRAIAILGDLHITLAESKLLKLSYIIKILKSPVDGSLKMLTVKSN